MTHFSSDFHQKHRGNTDVSFFQIKGMAWDGERLYPVWLAACGKRDAFDTVLSHNNLRIALVLESNPSEGWCNDVTEDFLNELSGDKPTVLRSKRRRVSAYGHPDRVGVDQAGIESIRRVL